jgi:hypothetical protein
LLADLQPDCWLAFRSRRQDLSAIAAAAKKAHIKLIVACLELEAAQSVQDCMDDDIDEALQILAEDDCTAGPSRLIVVRHGPIIGSRMNSPARKMRDILSITNDPRDARSHAAPASQAVQGTNHRTSSFSAHFNQITTNHHRAAASGASATREDGYVFELTNATTPCAQALITADVLASVVPDVLSIQPLVPRDARSSTTNLHLEDGVYYNSVGLSNGDSFAAAYLQILRKAGLSQSEQVAKCLQGHLPRMRIMANSPALRSTASNKRTPEQEKSLDERAALMKKQLATELKVRHNSSIDI